MSGYKSFAVWGAGRFDKPIVGELLKLKAQGVVDSVAVLTHPASKDDETNKELAAQGAQILPFDVEGEDAASVLFGIDVLISTAGFIGQGLVTQLELVHVAKNANVKLFVPSEWGDDTDGREEPTYKLKAKVRAAAESIGLPIALVFNGLWLEFLPIFFFDVKNDKVTIKGEGNGITSFTSLFDVARYTAHVLTALEREKIEGTKFRIEGDRSTFNEIVSRYQQATGKQLEVTHVPRAELEEALQKDPNDILSALFLGWDTGKGVVGTPEQLTNNLWPEWNPKNAIDVLLAIDSGSGKSSLL